MSQLIWQCGSHRFDPAGRPLVLGIVNVTPDSFSDGGKFLDPAAAVDHALKLAGEGADLLDVGGESTRPGASPVSLDDELRRVLPVVAALAKRTAVPISVDTMKAEVARRCVDAGAVVINDVSGFRDPAMVRVAAESGAGVIVMHMQGVPATMQQQPTYRDVVFEVCDYFAERLRTLEEAGVPRERVCLDPGIGFGKTMEHNLELMAQLAVFRRLDRPVCLGVSRKGVVGTLAGRERHDRLAASLAAACFALAQDGAQVLRVHDVAATVDAVKVWQAVREHRGIPW